ncbi:MAG: polymer-forming cytoskeletal protein, partial [Gammaproteobacteria bacterium]|nr:polymer-forming cytoskeletal protein [Gammaproteobacteria bacterium]
IKTAAETADRPAAREVPRPSISPKVDQAETPARPQSAEAAEESLPAPVLSVLSATVVVKGDISADDEIIIHGTVEGTIAHDMKKVVVGKEGRVRALIHASIVSVQGHVDGDIHASELVELLAGARVEGDIYTPAFRVEKGARYNGTVNMPPA